MLKTTYVITATVLFVLIVAGAFASLYLSKHTTSGTTTSSSSNSNSKIQVVAAENFWGSLISQLGGTHINVLSIVSDPNADPHEYESNSTDAKAIANASLVIVNGAGYDEWALKLIAASSTPHQIVLNVQELINQSVGVNPHFWYSPYYVNDTVKAMYQDLVSVDPTNAAYYKQQYVALNASLGVYNARIDEIKQQFGGAKVASTESIFVYLANATGLDLVSPPAFMEAVSEGNDPPAQSIVQFQQLIQNETITVLVYNEQTVTPLTQNIRAQASQQGIQIVGVTETIQPPDATFQDWMNSQLLALQNALALGK
ncbi:MAG: zinc ABC transporter substrate-binding protein [Nitrososphaeria archaeon]|jgi:zinc/manganese transport system substrate-binding protein